MMASITAFLASIASQVVIALLSAAAGWFGKMIHQQIQDKKSDTDAAQSVDPLKKAKTGDEIDKASDGALGGF